MMGEGISKLNKNIENIHDLELDLRYEAQAQKMINVMFLRENNLNMVNLFDFTKRII